MATSFEACHKGQKQKERVSEWASRAGDYRRDEGKCLTCTDGEEKVSEQTVVQNDSEITAYRSNANKITDGLI